MYSEKELRRLLTDFLAALHCPTAEEGFAGETLSLPRLTWTWFEERGSGTLTLRLWCADHAGCMAGLERLRELIPWPGVTVSDDSLCVTLSPKRSRIEAGDQQPCRAVLEAEVDVYGCSDKKAVAG